jgi:prolipoprotein diacylglyceryltransferase
LRYGIAPLHPVQLYEAAVNILIGILMMVLIRKCKPGMAASAYLGIYGIVRFADEFFRGDHRQFWNGLTPAQTIGLIMIPAGIALMIYFSRKPVADDAA